MFIRALAILAILAVFGGCTDSTKIETIGDENTQLDPRASFYISVPKNGRYGQTIYRGSGDTTANIIKNALARYVEHVEIGLERQSLEEALQSARAQSAKYVVFPMILAWEDRATEWSGKADRVSVKISIVEVHTEDVLNTAVVSGRSGLATLGGDHPQDLVPLPVDEYLSRLF